MCDGVHVFFFNGLVEVRRAGRLRVVVFDFEYWSRAYEMIPWTRSFTGIWMCSAMPSNAWKSSSFSRMMRLVCNDVVAMVFDYNKVARQSKYFYSKVVIRENCLTCRAILL